MLKNVCRIVVLVWGALAVIGGIGCGNWFAVAIGLVAMAAVA